MTFDDGPSAVLTPRLLDILKQRNIKATFYVVGKCAKAYPHIIRRILAEGHEIGNHTWDHKALSSLSDEQVRKELKMTEDAVFEASGYRMRSMRPPYGATNLRLNQMWFKEFGYPTMMWSVDPLDWKNRNSATVTSRIVNSVHKGAIILAHDIHGTTVNAMPSTFDQILAKGYRFLTVGQLLNLEKNSMPVGVVVPPTVDPSEMPAKTRRSS
jgi:peptidoglycan/xylan/chitin deacetylase (PgdA/CDA1 family)